MRHVLYDIPVELVDKILTFVDSPQDLHSLLLSAKYIYGVVKRHSDYRHIRCSIIQGYDLWAVLAADKSLAANVRVLEIQPEKSHDSHTPLKTMLLPSTLYNTPIRRAVKFKIQAEAMLTAALPNLTNLNVFRWTDYSPRRGNVYDPDHEAFLRELGLEDEEDDAPYGEEMWLGLATLKALRHVEIFDKRQDSRFPFDTSPLWSIRGLTSFTFNAEWGEYNFLSDPFDLFGLAEMLGNGCPALESIDITSNVFATCHASLDMIPPEESRGDMFLGPYVWPHLHTLRLSGIGCSSASARLFLRNHPGIETLNISRHFGLDIDEFKENYTDWDNTPSPIDTLPNLRWLTVEETEQAIRILSSPTTLPRPFTRLSGIFASKDIATHLTNLPHITRLDFGRCSLVNLVVMMANTALSTRLQWLDLGYGQFPRSHDWFNVTHSLIPTLGAFPNLVVFHGLELIRPDAPFTQNASIAANLLHTCPKLCRIDVWLKAAKGDFRSKDECAYIALSRDDDGIATWKMCKMNEWRDRWSSSIDQCRIVL